MARSIVLRRAAAALANFRTQCAARSAIASANILLPGRVSGAGSFHQEESYFARRFSTSGGRRTMAAATPAAVDDSTSTTLGRAACFNPATGTYSSTRAAIRAPPDPCMDLTSFILDGKDQKLGDKPALVDASTGESMSYNKFHHAVCAVELGLVSIGVGQGDVVFMMSQNCIHYPVVLLATTSVGGVLATMNPLCTPEEAKRMVELSKPRRIIVDEALVDKVSGLGVELVIIENGKKVKVGSTEVGFSELLDLDPECQSAPETKINQDDPAAILFSSGTTGLSKAVVLSHRNIISQVLQLEMLDGDEGGVHLCALPMCHVFGLVVIAMQQLYRGGTIVVTPKFDVDEAVACVEKYKVTHFYAVPSIISSLLKIMTTNTSSFSSLQRFMCGGAPLGKEQVQEMCKLLPQASFLQIYGLTEVAGATALINLKEDNAPGSVGTLLSNVEAKVLNSEKQPLPPNSQGELYLRGPNVMKGYANDQEANASTLDKDGWLATGDLASFDEEGHLFVIDRIKELIKYKAHQVAPAELEALLLTHSDIFDAAVVPEPIEEVGQIPVAFVVKTSAGSSLSEEDVKNFVAQRVAPFKKLRRVLFVDEIPKTMSGKILRKVLARSLSLENNSKKINKDKA